MSFRDRDKITSTVCYVPWIFVRIFLFSCFFSYIVTDYVHLCLALFLVSCAFEAVQYASFMFVNLHLSVLLWGKIPLPFYCK